MTAIFVKIGVKDIDSDLATAIRTVVILVITWSIVLYKGVPQNMTNISITNWSFLILSGVATGLSWLFYFRAIQLGQVSKVAPVDKLSLAFVLILSVVFLGEAVSLKLVIGTLFVIVGALILIL